MRAHHGRSPNTGRPYFTASRSGAICGGDQGRPVGRPGRLRSAFGIRSGERVIRRYRRAGGEGAGVLPKTSVLVAARRVAGLGVRVSARRPSAHVWDTIGQRGYGAYRRASPSSSQLGGLLHHGGDRGGPPLTLRTRHGEARAGPRVRWVLSKPSYAHRPRRGLAEGATESLPKVLRTLRRPLRSKRRVAVFPTRVRTGRPSAYVRDQGKAAIRRYPARGAARAGVPPQDEHPRRSLEGRCITGC
jgi:hypothetical protein